MHRVSRRTVERWIANDKLAKSKLPGGLVRISRSDAEALLIPTRPRPAVLPSSEGTRPNAEPPVHVNRAEDALSPSSAPQDRAVAS
jgi:excisionase family DNA binding protein